MVLFSSTKFGREKVPFAHYITVYINCPVTLGTYITWIEDSIKYP